MRRAGGHQVNLSDVARELAENWQRDGWGRYGPAVRRWEQVIGRPAPFPGERTRLGSFRLNPLLPEFLLGLPEGWVSAVPGLPWYAMIKVLGNGVVPAQAAAALRLLAAVAGDLTGTGRPRACDRCDSGLAA